MNNSLRNNTFNAGLLLSSVLLLFFVYANSSVEFSLFDYKIVKSKELQFSSNDQKNIKKRKKTTNVVYDEENSLPAKIDTTHKRFLLIGDSQVGGIMRPFYNYCKFNGHELVFAQVWYSARDITYADNDTLKQLIETYKPDHIVMVIGLNQVYQSYFSQTEDALNKILNTFKDIPYTWVGPASWVPDNGITQFYKENLDEGCFFASDTLVLARGSDGRHPSTQAYSVWMDAIAKWMQNKSIHHIKMNKPDKDFYGYNFKYRTFNAGHKNDKDTLNSVVDTNSSSIPMDSSVITKDSLSIQ